MKRTPCNFLISPTGKTELVDFGSGNNWSPVDHVFQTYISKNDKLNRLVLTHHHGDHLSDWDNLKNRRIGIVLRRRMEGAYLTACKESNYPEGQKLAKAVDDHFSTWIGEPDDSEISAEAWGVNIESRQLTIEHATEVSSTPNAIVNNCSRVRLYEHNGIKILLAGDIEKEGMKKLLELNPKFQAQLSGLNILIAPHHGHSSSFSTELFESTGQVNVVIASMMSGDKNVDGRYSDQKYAAGIPFDDGTTKKLLTTRSHGAISCISKGDGTYLIQIYQR
jgi:beta-lactamase superfamily II metal-dependent hydrolase